MRPAAMAMTAAMIELFALIPTRVSSSIPMMAPSRANPAPNSSVPGSNRLGCRLGSAMRAEVCVRRSAGRQDLPAAGLMARRPGTPASGRHSGPKARGRLNADARGGSRQPQPDYSPPDSPSSPQMCRANHSQLCTIAARRSRGLVMPWPNPL